MWIHREYYTEDGVYVEGVAQYAFMSLEGQMTLSALSRASFGFVPAAIDVDRIQLTATYIIESMSSDGYLINFGDSWDDRGFTNPSLVAEAVIAPTIINGDAVSALINSSQIRVISSSAYGSGGFYGNPWRKRGAVMQFNDLPNGRASPMYASQPLGPQSISVFPHGGYARFLTPLLSTDTSTPICFSGNEDCIGSTYGPNLWGNIPYNSISIQARENSFAHSEVDFATFIWSAYGSRLISEFGYSTIATSISQGDMRRYDQLDNNPAGHNTLIIREAFQSGSETINFSQLNYIKGTLSSELIFSDGTSCVLLDGSEVYGASRTDGWLDIMKRYFCTLEGGQGATLMLDIMQTKENREAMSLYGSQNGGPDFNESTSHQSLTIDEYFYTDTHAEISITNDIASEVLPFVRTSGNADKWCRHVDVELILDDNNNHSTVALRPVCGIGSWRPGDGMGVIAGISLAANGQFVYDGLITASGQWEDHKYKKRRFRFVTDQTVDSDGDVRAFVLSPSLSATPLQPPDDVALSDCSTDISCGASPTIICSCIEMCIGGSLKRITVQSGEIDDIEDIESC